MSEPGTREASLCPRLVYRISLHKLTNSSPHMTVSWSRVRYVLSSYGKWKRDIPTRAIQAYHGWRIWGRTDGAGTLRISKREEMYWPVENYYRAKPRVWNGLLSCLVSGEAERGWLWSMGYGQLFCILYKVRTSGLWRSLLWHFRCEIFSGIKRANCIQNLGLCDKSFTQRTSLCIDSLNTDLQMTWPVLILSLIRPSLVSYRISRLRALTTSQSSNDLYAKLYR